MKRTIVAALIALLGLLGVGMAYHHSAGVPVRADMYGPHDMYGPNDMYGPHDMS